MFERRGISRMGSLKIAVGVRNLGVGVGTWRLEGDEGRHSAGKRRVSCWIESRRDNPYKHTSFTAV